jgi:hypothetical protein
MNLLENLQVIQKEMKDNPLMGLKISTKMKVNST